MQEVTLPKQSPLESSKAAGAEDPRLRQACQQFEEIFLRMLLKEMRATVPDSGLLPAGLDSEIFRDLLDESYARAASQAGGIGLADRLYQQLLLATTDPARNLHSAGRRF